MAWGTSPPELIKYWSTFLDDELDLAGYYTSETHVRQELASHPDIAEYADAAVQAWNAAKGT